MGQIVDALMKASGTIGNTAGAIGDVMGAFLQRKEAKKQLELGNKLATQQKLGFDQAYSDLFSLLGQQQTYKGDVSEYKRAEKEAERQQALAQKIPIADQLYRDQATKTASNTFARATKGARSATDLMSLAGMVGSQENQQMQNINIDTANRKQSMEQQANQARISTIANTAAATARERGLEFQSILNKSNQTIDLTRERDLGRLNQDWNLAQANMAQRGALANSNAAIFSGLGNIVRAMGNGVAQQNYQNQQLDAFKGYMGGQSVAPQQQSLGGFEPSFNYYGNDLFNLAKTFPTGWGSAGTPN